MYNSAVGDIFVPLFFVAGAAASFFIGWRYAQSKHNTLRIFGGSIALYGLAFAIWSIMVFTKHNVELITTLGVLPLIAGLFLSFYTGIQGLGARSRTLLMGGGALYLVALVFMRLFIFPSTPGFSENGLFYFHAEPAVVAMYVGAFTGALLPAVSVVASHLSDRMLRRATRLGLTILTIGGIVLVTSLNDDLQTINGWVMGLTLIALTAVYAVKKVS